MRVFMALLLVLTFLGCAHRPDPLPPLAASSKILLPKPPILKEVVSTIPLEAGSRVMPKGKQPFSVLKGGGAFLPKPALDAIYENSVLKDYYIFGVVKQAEIHNKSLEAAKTLAPAKGSWWKW